MKRFLFILSAMCILYSATVLAGDIGISSMSIDELMELRTAIEEELWLRMEAGSSPIGSGMYRVGIDIKAGTYYISDAKPSGLYFCIQLYEDEDALANREEMTGFSNSGYLDEGEDATVSLHDGMIMLIDSGSAVMQEIKPSWAP